MRNRIHRLAGYILPSVVGGWMLQAGCIRDLQRELEVLIRPEANPLLIRESFLVNVFGVEILRLFDWIR